MGQINGAGWRTGSRRAKKSRRKIRLFLFSKLIYMKKHFLTSDSILKKKEELVNWISIIHGQWMKEKKTLKFNHFS